MTEINMKQVLERMSELGDSIIAAAESIKDLGCGAEEMKAAIEEKAMDIMANDEELQAAMARMLGGNMTTARYVIRDDDQLKIVYLCTMPSDAHVVAEVMEDGENPLCLPHNPYSHPTDFWSPDNMFGGEPVRFSDLETTFRAVTEDGQT